ncbi:MAG: ABC transporter ATP-binding protein/permease [Bacteroidetes bacterium]|nr:ABC transporter ATP-binding protein/permease [Rhodothermia bacterium]MCS7155625.1 ABC transporter ATP-binding protein/permease [Bacteroidota bacterium]MCX7906484.1 ABC transporter ATP-binding protein/permease [Bacteroidota bacterium]MDW8137235.1 ABC transporter ATP-binding protein [Bacteroidota bacterium]MDW8284895.1 ABC transporter ATP-binding protein [Bacteroidota bacterium]
MKPLRALNRYLLAYWRHFLPGLLCVLLSSLFAVLSPVLVRQAVDTLPVLASWSAWAHETPLGEALRSISWALLLGYGLALVGFTALSGLFLFLTRQTIIVASRHIEYDLRNALFAHLERLGARFFNQHPTGDLMTRAMSDIERVRLYVGPALMYTARSGTLALFALLMMILTSPTLTLYTLLPLPALSAAIYWAARLLHERSEHLQAQYARLTSRAQEAFSGIRVLQAFAQERFEQEAFAQESRAYQRRALELARVESLFSPAIMFLTGLSALLVLWIGGRFVIEGRLTIGNIAEYLIYLALLTWPVTSVGWILNMIQRASASQERLLEVLRTEPEVQDRPSQQTRRLGRLQGHLIVEDVWFRYAEDRPWALAGLSLEIHPGQWVAIVGPTGAGKSTLLRLLCRQYAPDRGRIYLDGQPLEEIPLAILRRDLAVVPQEAFLFSETIAYNIAFGRPQSTEAEIEHAARLAALDPEGFPEGLQTWIGERGVTLSGGQRQRLAIARALLVEPQILLLDDAFASIDSATEATILEALRRWRKSRTLILISHRISTVKDADRIFYLERGRVLEVGDHETLLAQNGAYARLFRRQLLEAELEATDPNGRGPKGPH